MRKTFLSKATVSLSDVGNGRCDKDRMGRRTRGKPGSIEGSIESIDGGHKDPVKIS